MSDESTKKSSSREPKLGDTAVLEDGQSEKCRIDGVYKAAKCVNPDCSKHKRQPRALSTLFIVEELTTDDGLQLTGQDLRDARSNWIRALLSTGDSFVLELVSERLAITTLWAVIMSIIWSIAPEEAHLKEVFLVPEWPFELIGGFLSILLVFRTDQSYERFWEGRSRWAEMSANMRVLTRIALTSYSGPKLRKVLAHIAAFPVAMKQHLRGERNLQELQVVFDTIEDMDLTTSRSTDQDQDPPPTKARARSRTTPRIRAATRSLQRGAREGETPLDRDRDDVVQRVTSANNMPLSLLTSLSRAAAPPLGLPSAEAMFIRERMEDTITQLSMVVSGCEKIKRTPIPLAYSRNTSRFFTLFCLSLPFPLLHDCPPYIVPFLVAGFSWILYATEEIGHVIEQPFDLWETETQPEVPELQESEIEAVFRFFDSGNTGQIDKTEFFQAMLELGMPTPASEVEEIVDRYDTNGNQMLEFSEFRTLLSESLAERAATLSSKQQDSSGPAQLLGPLLIAFVRAFFSVFGKAPPSKRSAEILPLSRYCTIFQLDILQQAVLVSEAEEKERYMAMAGTLGLVDNLRPSPRFDWE